MPIDNPMDLFIHEMGDMFDAEQRILLMLPLLAEESNNPQVKSAYQQHERETREQITNLEECFRILGSTPLFAACMAVAGLKQEHDTFLKENPSENILMMFDLGAAAKTEYYEIASYKGLIEKARLMGQQQCEQLLQQNLSQEEAMAKRVEALSMQLGQQMIPQAS